LPADLSSCDCPDATFHCDCQGGYRHQQALRQALATRTTDLPRVMETHAQERIKRDDQGGADCSIELLCGKDVLKDTAVCPI
jgi:hypothetical protein